MYTFPPSTFVLLVDNIIICNVNKLNFEHVGTIYTLNKITNGQNNYTTKRNIYLVWPVKDKNVFSDKIMVT